MNVKSDYRRGVHWVAILATAFTLPLLYVGGSVTTYRVGLAVPDWPATFGENPFLYNFLDAPFGVKIEHFHRLYGAAVGLATIVLTGCLLAFARERWLKGLGVLALVAVILQGVLGGYRVNHRDTLLAAIHGSTGQAFFGLMMALCVLTGRDRNGEGTRSADPDHLRRRSSVVLALVYLQIVLGGWLRHYGTLAALWAHGILAAGVLAQSLSLAYRIERKRRQVSPMVVPGRIVGLAVTMQVALGLATLVFVLPMGGTPRAVTTDEAVIRTAHQTNAALLFAAAIVLTLRTYRHLAGATTVAGTSAVDKPVGRPGAAELDWEAVA
jgi:cytochrome c oxidase assembly protein subunit 15